METYDSSPSILLDHDKGCIWSSVNAQEIESLPKASSMLRSREALVQSGQERQFSARLPIPNRLAIKKSGRGRLQCQALFNFGKSDTAEKKYASSMSKEEYTNMDVEDYFNYMGMLAAEGNYDRMEKMLSTGVPPADLLLLMAASENDAPKVAELLRAGADLDAKDFNGKSAKDLTDDAEVLELLGDRQKAFSF